MVSFSILGPFGPSRDRDAPRRSESEEEEEEEQIVESDDEPQKKRKSSSKKPAPKKPRTEYSIQEHEKGSVNRPTENTITSTGAFNGEFAFALGTVCSVLCEKTNRWVTGHVIMFHRGGVRIAASRRVESRHQLVSISR